MKPVFISNNKMFYTAMLIICLGIIVVGINYNKNKQGLENKTSNKKMQNVISVEAKKVQVKKPVNTNKKMVKKSLSNQKKKIVKSSKISAVTEDNFFENYKIERDRTRDREIELLREIINNPQSDKVTRQDAQNKLFALTQNLEKEMDIENIIKANGFNNSVVFIHKSGVTVVIQNLKENSKQLEKEKAKVMDIVSLVTGFKKESIEIMFKS